MSLLRDMRRDQDSRFGSLHADVQRLLQDQLDLVARFKKLEQGAVVGQAVPTPVAPPTPHAERDDDGQPQAKRSKSEPRRARFDTRQEPPPSMGAPRRPDFTTGKVLIADGLATYMSLRNGWVRASLCQLVAWSSPGPGQVCEEIRHPV